MPLCQLVLPINSMCKADSFAVNDTLRMYKNDDIRIHRADDKKVALL